MFVIGYRSRVLGSSSVKTNCKNCNNEVIYTIVVTGTYLHLFWIPIFPLFKSVKGQCKNCNKVIDLVAFSPEMKNQYFVKMPEYKHPIFHWLGTIILVSLILIISLPSLFNKISSPFSKKPGSILNELEIEANGFPKMEDDSLSYKIRKEILIFQTTYDKKYLTIKEDNNLLVYVSVPYLNYETGDKKLKIYNDIQNIVENQKGLKDLKKLIVLRNGTGEFYFKEGKDSTLRFSSDPFILEYFLDNK